MHSEDRHEFVVLSNDDCKEPLLIHVDQQYLLLVVNQELGGVPEEPKLYCPFQSKLYCGLGEVEEDASCRVLGIWKAHDAFPNDILVDHWIIAFTRHCHG